MKTQRIEIEEISDHDRLWLNEIYIKAKRNELVLFRDVYSKLRKRLPKDYQPQVISENLIDRLGEKIKIPGIIALKGNKAILKRIDTLIECIFEIMVENPKLEEISIDQITHVLNWKAQEISFLLFLASEYKLFYSGYSSDANSRIIKSIRVGNPEVFLNYRNYKGIETLIFERQEARLRELDNFSSDDVRTLNTKLDSIKAGLIKNNLLHEVNWAVLHHEIEELKGLYTLSKKNWRQVFLGKLWEMVISGIVSETASKYILKFLSPAVKGIFNGIKLLSL